MPNENGEENPPAAAGLQMQAPQLPLPEKFEGSNGPKQSELWPKWLRRFERYRYASGLSNKTEPEQVATLLYSMGDCADDILTTLDIDESKASYQEVKTALNTYYKVRTNVIVERAKFNTRLQQENEPIDTFIQDLYRMVESCNFGTLKDEFIRDRIVVGVHSENLSDSLQAINLS